MLTVEEYNSFDIKTIS